MADYSIKKLQENEELYFSDASPDDGSESTPILLGDNVYTTRIDVDKTYTAENPYHLASGTYTCPAATDNNGGAVYVHGLTSVYANLSGENITFKNNETTGRGGAVYAFRSTVTLTGVTFIDNKANSYGGALYVSNSTVTICDATFSGNSSYNGGAVYAGATNSTYLTINGSSVSFESNTANQKDSDSGTGWGGAICQGGTLTINCDATFTGNKATNRGGAIYQAGTITINGNATFTNNSAATGGAIYSIGHTLTINGDATFNGNKATNKGGAIYYTVSDSQPKTGTITFNGIVDLQTDSDTWVNEGFYDKTSGMTKYTAVNWDLTGGLAQYATVKGFQRYSNLAVDVSGTPTVLSYQYITVNAAQESGNYVIATGDFAMSTLTTNNSTGFTVTNGTDSVSITINGDVAMVGTQSYKLALVESGTPGADQLVLTAYDERIEVDNTYTAENPYVLTTGKTYTAAPYFAKGDAVYVSQGGNLTGENVTFANNSTKGSTSLGGAVYNAGTMTLNDAVFTGNTSDGIAGIAGALCNQNGTLTINDHATFTGNRANKVGGAIYNDSGTLTINGDAVFSGNTSVYTSGGAIGNKGTLTINGDAIFNGNTAAQSGGAIYNTCKGSVSGTITFNGTVDLQTDSDTWVNVGYSTRYTTVNWDLTGGLAQYATIKGFQRYSNLTVASSGTVQSYQHITVNAAQEIGEYVIATGDMTGYASDTTKKYTFTLKTAEDATGKTLTVGSGVNYNGLLYSLAVNDNDTPEDATDDKLVLSVKKLVTTRVVVARDGSETLETGAVYICPEIAEYEGGAVYINAGGTLTGENVTFANNSVTGQYDSGGAIYSLGATVTLTNVTFTGNTAPSSGGALFMTESTVSICDAAFSGNTAKMGGAIQVNSSDDSLTLTGSIVSFSGNTAAQKGGGAINNSNGTVTINADATTFTNNSGATTGGAIYNFNGTLNIDGDVTFKNNSATTGGAIYNLKGTVNFSSMIDLQTDSDTWVNVGSGIYYTTVNWDLTGGLTQYATIKGFQRYSNLTVASSGTVQSNQYITVNAAQESGDYVIATGDMTGYATDTTKKYTFTLKTAEDATGKSITVGSHVIYNGLLCSLAVNDNDTPTVVTDDNLVLSVENTIFYNKEWTTEAQTTYKGITWTGTVGDGTFYNDIASFNAATAAKKVYLSTEEEEFTTTVFGGGSEVQIEGGSYQNLIGGKKIDTATADTGDLSVAINNGTFNKAVAGGDGNVASENYTRTGDVNLSIAGGTFEKWAVGGEFYCPTELDTAEDGSVDLDGDVNFTISGGTFSGRIYGGCLARTADLGGNTVIEGDVNLTFDANNTVTICEHVVAGSRGSGKITGSTNITFTGAAGTGADCNLKFDDKSVVFGGSNNDTYKRSSDGTETIKSTVDGDRNLIFDAFSGDFDAEIKLFSTATFKNGSEVAFTDSDLNLTPVETWNFEFGSSIEDLAKNDFTDDTLNFDMAGYDNSEWTVLSGSKDALTGLFDAGSVIIGGETAELSQDNLSWCSTSYKLTKTNSGDTYSMMITKA